MRPSFRHQSGLTLKEVLVLLFVCFVLYTLAMPRMGNGLGRGQQTQTLSNMKQLHLSTQQMALDGGTLPNPALGWPGDTGDSFMDWTTHLVKGGYLSAADLAKLLSAPGVVVSSKTNFTTNSTALLLYAVKEKSRDDAVFLSTANFTNTPTGGVVDPLAKPYGAKGFLIFHRAGDGAILASKQAGQTNIIGSYVPLCP